MSEFLPDFSSPEALVRSYEERAKQLRVRAARIADQDDREMYELLADGADEDAARIRRKIADGFFKGWYADDSKQE